MGMGKAGMGATSGPRTTHASDTWTCPGEPYASRREAASTAALVEHTRRTDGHQRVLTGTPGVLTGTPGVLGALRPVRRSSRDRREAAI